MKRAVVLAIATAAGLTILTIPAQSKTRLSAAMCQPLNSANLERCCDAGNWRDIILMEHQHLCARLRGEDRIRAALRTDAVRGGSPDDPIPGFDGPGNPGNNNRVGAAGEKDSFGMRNTVDSVGTHGNSDNPDKGGPKP